MKKHMSYITIILSYIIAILIGWYATRLNLKTEKPYIHPHPKENLHYEVFDPDTNRKTLDIYAIDWSDNEIKNLNITFYDSDNSIWYFLTVSPHDPSQWKIRRRLDSDGDMKDIIPNKVIPTSLFLEQ